MNTTGKDNTLTHDTTATPKTNSNNTKKSSDVDGIQTSKSQNQGEFVSKGYFLFYNVM